MWKFRTKLYEVFGKDNLSILYGLAELVKLNSAKSAIPETLIWLTIKIYTQPNLIFAETYLWKS